MPQDTPNESPQSKSGLLEKAKKFLALAEKEKNRQEKMSSMTKEVGESLKTEEEIEASGAAIAKMRKEDIDSPQ